MIESEDEGSSSEPEDNQEEVGHQILCGSNIKVFSLKRILLNNKLKNTCQPFHGECQELVPCQKNLIVS